MSADELGLSVVCAKGVDFEIATLAQRRPEAENNAALIAAAPDLLEALDMANDMLIMEYEGDFEPGSAMRIIRDAISKARGE